jgi:hypothetical protein
LYREWHLQQNLNIFQVNIMHVVDVWFLIYGNDIQVLTLALLPAHMDRSSIYTKHHKQQIAGTAVILCPSDYSEL